MRPPPQQPLPPPPLGDAELLARVAAGDRSALAELYRRHAGWLTARLQRRCTDRELVDTSLQETFLAVWRRAGSFRGEGDVGAWLWSIAVRKLVDELRRRRPEPVDPVVFAAPVGSAPTPGGVPVPGATATRSQPSAEAEVLARGIGDLSDAFTRLPSDLQQVLLATAVDGLTTREAARLLGIPHGTVKTRLARARTRMQEHLP
ncbi:MAG: RNA polymerase sigma factor [Acidimicrobiales bacterium]|nr:RNA polymerase sigma factor [Acidimicrobiales bacterium]